MTIFKLRTVIVLKTDGIKELFRDVSGGNRNAFNTLFRQYYGRLVGFARSFVAHNGLAEEVVSDLFVTLWTDKEQLVHISNPDTYLYVSVRNRCLNAMRKKTHTVSIEEDTDLKNAGHENPQQQLEQKELYDRLNRLVARLPEQQQRVFRMMKESGLSAKQCAQILGISVRTVETHLYQAVKQLEKEITDYLGYSPKKRQVKKILSVLW